MSEKMEERVISKEVVNIYTKSKIDNDLQIGTAYRSLGDVIYTALKRKIVYHQIKPGERVIDKHLAKEFGVSRSLVRQALTVLEKEDLVESVPRSGFYVKELTKDEVGELYDIRCILEMHATELAVARIPDREIAKLDKIFNEAKKDLNKDKVEKFIEADAELHRVIVNNCGNNLLINLINKYNDRYIFYRIVDLARIPRAKEAYYEHLEIFNAVKDRDTKLATELMEIHIKEAKKIILDKYDEYTFAEKN